MKEQYDVIDNLKNCNGTKEHIEKSFDPLRKVTNLEFEAVHDGIDENGITHFHIEITKVV